MRKLLAPNTRAIGRPAGPPSCDAVPATMIDGTPAKLRDDLVRILGHTLTARERDILVMISRGLSNKRIARDLYISPETVKSHVKRIFRKLAVSTRAEAAFRAVSLGLL
jgi:DNA-binding CsgD family transcriptional regulator